MNNWASFVYLQFSFTEMIKSEVEIKYGSFQNHHIYKSQWPTLSVLLFAWNRISNCDKKKLFRENIRL